MSKKKKVPYLELSDDTLTISVGITEKGMAITFIEGGKQTMNARFGKEWKDLSKSIHDLQRDGLTGAIIDGLSLKKWNDAYRAIHRAEEILSSISKFAR